MALLKSFTSLNSAACVRCVKPYTGKYEGIRNGFVLLSPRDSFQNEICRSITRKITKGREPKNVGLSFEGGRTSNLTMSSLMKPFTFTMAFSAGTFAACAIWQYENVRLQVPSFIYVPNLWHHKKDNQGNKQLQWRDKINRIWNKLSEAEKLFFSICAVNIVIHLLWKVPNFQTTMMKYFSSNPRSSAICWPLLLSTFSHYSTIHILMNMYSFYSISVFGINDLGKEQFLGLYLAGGVISSFTSLFVRVATQRPNMSLGASGAILAIVGYITSKYPDLKFSIIGFPACTFTAGSLLTALIAFDLIGLVCAWKIIDHAAHLGGTCFGIFWYYWGNPNIWQKREPFLQWWHKLRNSHK